MLNTIIYLAQQRNQPSPAESAGGAILIGLGCLFVGLRAGKGCGCVFAVFGLFMLVGGVIGLSGSRDWEGIVCALFGFAAILFFVGLISLGRGK